MKHLHRMLLVVSVSVAPIIGGTFAAGQGVTRTIRYQRNVPIAAQLTTGDTSVAVVKATFPPLTGNSGTESFEEEAKRVSQFPEIAIWQMSTKQGELIDNGAWIRTRVTGQAAEFMKAGSQAGPGSSLEFWHDGGTTTIGSVAVTAGVFPRFAEGQQYLVFLAPDREPGVKIFALGFRVDPNGNLAAMEWSDGRQISAESKLIGHNLSAMRTALK
jgi:hypothetical protein